MAKKTNEKGMSYETKTIVVVLTLLFVTPVGLILMWVWMKWPMWLKILLTVIPFLFTFLVLGFILAIFGFVFSNPDVQKQMKQQMQEQQKQTTQISQAPQYTLPLLAHWKLYNANRFSFQYPDSWYLQDSLPSDPEFSNVTIQNYDPRTAAPREYSPTLDKGKVKIDLMKRPLGRTLTELKKTLAKQDKQNAIDSGKENIIYKYTEKVVNMNDKTIYIRTYDEDSVAYILNGEGDVIIVAPVLDTKAGIDVFNELLPTVQFTHK